MNPISLVFAVTAAIVACAATAQAADDAALFTDLKATIVLQGHPCDQISSTKRLGDSDYTAVCKDGNRYHIYVNTQGRVVVDKL